MFIPCIPQMAAVCLSTVKRTLSQEDDSTSLNIQRMAEVLVVVSGDVSQKDEKKSSTAALKRNVIYYNPLKERWRILTELPFCTRSFYTVTILNNCIYVCGGEDENEVVTRDVFVYDVQCNSWLSNNVPMLKTKSQSQRSYN